MLYKTRYILWAFALPGACYVTQDGGHLGCPLGCYAKLEIIKTGENLHLFDARHVEYDIIKHFASFLSTFCAFFLLKRRKNTFLLKSGLTTCYSILMTSYLVAIVTDSHQNGVKMCLRDMRRATQGAEEESYLTVMLAKFIAQFDLVKSKQ